MLINLPQCGKSKCGEKVGKNVSGKRKKGAKYGENNFLEEKPMLKTIFIRFVMYFKHP